MVMSDIQDWVAQAQEILQPILDGSEITGRYFEVEEEAMRGILDRVDRLANHFKTLPLACTCDDEGCPGYRRGWDARTRRE